MARYIKDRERVVLHPMVQNILFSHYEILYGGEQRIAAGSLGISQRMYSAYENSKIRSVPAELFYEICGALRMYKDNWTVEPKRIISDKHYAQAALEIYRGISGGWTKAGFSTIESRNNIGKRKAKKMADAINNFKLCGLFDLENPEVFISERTTDASQRGIGIRKYLESYKRSPEARKRMDNAIEVQRKSEKNNPELYKKRITPFKASMKSGRQKGRDALKKKYGDDYLSVLGTMRGLRVSIESMQQMEAAGKFEFLSAMDSIEKETPEKPYCGRRFISERLSCSLYQVSLRLRILEDIGLVKRTGHIGKKVKLTPRGRKMLWVYNRLKAAGRI